jgi:hypothetical protein
VNYFIPKLMIIRWYSLFLGSFAPHFQIKLSIHGSYLNSILVIMSELKFFLNKAVLTQHFNIVDLVKFLEKNQKLHILIVAVTFKVTLCTDRSKKKVKKSEKTKILRAKQTSFSAPCPLGSFIHMAECRSSSKNTGKMSLIPVFNKNSPWAHMKSKLDVLGVHGKL